MLEEVKLNIAMAQEKQKKQTCSSISFQGGSSSLEKRFHKEKVEGGGGGMDPKWL